MGKTLRILSEKSEATERFVCLDEDDDSAFPRMGDLPNKLKYPAHIANIYTAIRKNEHQELEKLLMYDMQCSPVSAQQGSWGYTHIPSTYKLYTRPFIEWLFFEERDEFHSLIKAILGIESTPSQGDSPKEANAGSAKFAPSNTQGDLPEEANAGSYNLDIPCKEKSSTKPNTKLIESTQSDHRENLCKAFVDCLKKTDLKNPLFLELNHYTQKIIALDLLRLKTHSQVLESNQDKLSMNRSTIITNLLVSLTQQFNGFLHSSNNLPENTEKLWTLNFKLDFVKKIHSKDKRDTNNPDKNLGLTEHRDGGTAILFGNTLSMLFAGIPNLMLGITTKGSQWLFFQRTATQELLTELESNLNLPSLRIS